MSLKSIYFKNDPATLLNIKINETKEIIETKIVNFTKISFIVVNLLFAIFSVTNLTDAVSNPNLQKPIK